MFVGLILLVGDAGIEVQLKLVDLTLLVVPGSDDGSLRGSVERRRRQRHDGKVPGVVAADRVGDAVRTVVTYFEDFLYKDRKN